MAKKTELMQTVEGYGLIGIVLHLNLAQAQQLAKLYHEVTILDNPKTDIQEAQKVREEITSFLKLFKDIDFPEKTNIWGTDEQKEIEHYT